MTQHTTHLLLVGVLGLAVGIGIGYGPWLTRAPGACPMADRASSHGMMMDHGAMEMGAMMDAMNASLAGKTGDALDRAFLDEMIVHHEGAVAMAETLLQDTKRPELVELGKAIIAAQEQEITMMRTWRSEWFRD